MAQKKRRVPRRTATRPGAQLSVVREQPRRADLLQEDRPQVRGIAGSLLTTLDDVRHRMDAELVITSVLGTIGAALGSEADDLKRVEAPTALMRELVDECREAPGPRTLGLLTLLADQGPADSREAARQAGQELADRGIRPPRWAAPVPIRVIRAWMYGDADGSQSSYGMAFSYGHRDHTLMVLIDHQLGGGIKDAWFDLGSDGRRAHESAQAMAAGNPAAFFRDLDAGEALPGVRKALACPPCPAQPDQIEDIDAFLYLTHTRVRQLAALLGEPDVPLWSDLLWIESQEGGPTAEDEAEAVAEHRIYRVKVTLADSKPPIWRRLELPGVTLLSSIPEIVQTAFGGDDSGPFGFDFGTGRGRRPVHEDDLAATALFSLVGGVGDKATYTSHRGRHTLALEQTLEEQPGVRYPRCTGGRRGRPGDTDPAKVDLGAINRDLERLRLAALPDQGPLDRLVARSGDLKVALVTFAQHQRFRRAMSAAAAQDIGSASDPETGAIEFMESFMLRHRFEDGHTLVEKFAAERTDLPQDERDMLLGWVDPIEEILQIERIEGQSLVATSLFNDLTYRVRSNMGVQVFRPMPPGSFVALKLVPVMDEWLVSGVMVPFGADLAENVHGFAARRALDHPEVTFRNPEHLETAWKVQREDRDAFVEFFGNDVVILPRDECRRQFLAFRRSRQPGADDRSLGGAELPFTEHPIAMIYDKVEGMGFFTEYGAFLEGFENPGQVDQKSHAELVLSYLHDDTTGAAPFRVCARRNPATVDEVLARTLGRPGFSWARDGEALLMEFKPWLGGQHPRIVPLTPRLAEYVAKHGMD